jgi:LysM repeat protein/tetratricopeptide (TPR) repeat protein
LKSKNFRSAIFFAAFISGFSVNLFACGPDFPNTLLGAGDKGILQPPFADFQHELERLKLAGSSLRPFLPAGGQTYPDQAAAAEMADLAEALKRSGALPALATAILTEHLHQRTKLKAVQEARTEWRRNFSCWKSDYAWHSAGSIQLSPPDPSALNANLRQMQIQLLPPFVHLVGTRDQAASEKESGVGIPGVPDISDAACGSLEVRAESLRVNLPRLPEAQAVLEWMRSNPPPVAVDVQVTPGLPREFADYFKGAVAMTQPSRYDAETIWLRLLQLPPAERHYKSTWAAYMLGKSRVEDVESVQEAYEKSADLPPPDGDEIRSRQDHDEARKYFQLVRELARQGFADSCGLAVASLGEEARVCLAQKDYERAIELYLQQYAAGDGSAVNSLRFTAAIIFRQRGVSPGQFAALAKNSRARRVLTAYLISYRLPGESVSVGDWTSQAAVKAPGGTASVWLDAVEAANIKEVEGASQFALAAYQAGRMELAQRWIQRAGNEPAARWLQAKLLLRQGKLDEAAKLLALVSRQFPQQLPALNRPATFAGGLTVSDRDMDGEYFLVSAGREALGELGVLHLTRREYAEALDALLRSTYWMDAAYVAERVLTTDELKAYVERNWPAISDRHEEPPYDDHFNYDEHRPTLRQKIRYLLARRLARDGRCAEARKYYPEDWRSRLDVLVASLKTGRDVSVPPLLRAAALMSAASITRTNGMELLGTELAPDWFVEQGNFQDGITWHGRMEGRAAANINVASADEIERAKAHHADPEERFHYRSLARDLKIEAAGLFWDAAQLAPDNSDETARLLVRGGIILSCYDTAAAAKFFKALVHRCGKTLIGRQADKLRWFPELDENGNLKNIIPWIDDVDPTMGLVGMVFTNGAGEVYRKFPVPGEAYRVQPGDTLMRIARAATKLGGPVTVPLLLEANPGVNPSALRVGKLLAIPGAMTREPAKGPPMPSQGECLPQEKELDAFLSQVEDIMKYFPVEGGEFIVHLGDTCQAICEAANRLGVPLAFGQLQEANPGVDPRKLKVGQKLKIPRPATVPSPAKNPGAAATDPRSPVQYVVRSGDTLISILHAFNQSGRFVSCARFYQANPGTRPQGLQVGQVLNIP